MEKELLELIMESKKGDKESLLEVILKFSKLINKYKRKLNYEDAENDLIEHLIIVIYKMPLLEYGKAVNYIVSSIRNKYIYLSKVQNHFSHEIDFDNIDEYYEEKMDLYDMEELLLNLSDQQKKVIRYRYYYGYTGKEIGGLMKISRQAVCKNRKLGLQKLKQLLQKEGA